MTLSSTPAADVQPGFGMSLLCKMTDFRLKTLFEHWQCGCSLKSHLCFEVLKLISFKGGSILLQ